MAEIGVVVARGSKRIFWQSLTRALAKEPGFRVYKTCWRRQLERTLRKRQPQVLLAEMPRDEGAAYLKYLDEWPALTIIGLDPACADMIVRKRNIGLDLLVRLIRTVADEQAVVGDRPRMTVLTPTDVQQLASDGPDLESEGEGTLASEQHDGERSALFRWLDVCLHQRLAAEPTNDDNESAPAWGLTLRRARALLGDELQHKSRRQLSELRKSIESSLFSVDGAADETAMTSAFRELCNAFKLKTDERQILLMALAPELDGRYARIFGFLNDDLTRRRPTATLLAQLLSEQCEAWSVRAKLSSHRRLGRHALVRIDPHDSMPASDAGIMPAPDITAFLLAGDGRCEYPLFLTVVESDGADARAAASTSRLRALLDDWKAVGAARALDLPTLQLVGDAAAVQWFQRGALEAGHTLVVFNLAVLDESDTAHLRDCSIAATRVAALHDAVLLVVGRSSLAPPRREYFDGVLIAEIRQRVSRLVVQGEAGWLTRVSGSVRRIERPRSGTADRAVIWQERAQEIGLPLTEADAMAMASTVRFTEPEVDATLKLAGREGVNVSRLKAAARLVARTAVPEAVRRIEPSFDWDDIVLSEAPLRQLKEIPEHVRHAGMVLEGWGYLERMPYGHGVAALFSGPSGTGKTMAAQIIAKELEVDLLQVDLAKVVSKYIGETEKNLDSVFAAAERASAVLLIDEADALLAKRTDVRDAHDRYANLEVAYLLQRMEAYDGLAILTTNFKQNLDQAFTRRLRFSIDFPAPGASEREAIWERVFPEHAPLADDVSFTFLARRFELTGGSIQQIAVRAAFAAAGVGTIGMKHIAGATCDELLKLGMLNEQKSLAQLAGLAA